MPEMNVSAIVLARCTFEQCSLGRVYHVSVPVQARHVLEADHAHRATEQARVVRGPTLDSPDSDSDDWNVPL